MNYQDAKQIKLAAEEVNDLASAHLVKICAPHKTAMGLTSDQFKKTEEYLNAKLAFDTSFARLRTINSWIGKNFKKEMLAERKAKYAALDKIA